MAIRARMSRISHRIAVATYPLRLKLAMFVSLPRPPGARLTWKRVLNLYLQRWETMRLKSRVRSYPARLIVEPTNVCNLGCPACFTGDGQVSRTRSPMSADLYRRLLDEMGDYLLQVDFCNWGEPLLARDLPAMIQQASARGISTLISTNFSVPFDAERAERLVESGLAVLGVAIDGARQETYQQYRIGGDFEKVLHNCRLVVEAKQRLGATFPLLVWEFHVFKHNLDDVERARAMAAELGMEFCVEKGWVVGAEEKMPGYDFHGGKMNPIPCLFLWHSAVVNNDGGVSPCCGTFYREDDMGQLAAGGDQNGSRTFHEVWNGRRFREARRLYRSRTGDEETKKSICYDCPTTILWDRWSAHQAKGGTFETFEGGFSVNDGFNYFWNRRPEGWEQSARRRRVVPARG